MPRPSPPLAEFSEVLEKLAEGAELPPTEIAILSDIDRAQLTALEAAWPSIPDVTRTALVTEAVRLADERVDVEFSRFAGVALQDPLAEVRAAAIEALRESTDRQTAHLLVPILRDDPDEAVAAGAAELLGEFVLRLELGTFGEREGEPIIDGLRAVVSDMVRTPEVRANALEALAPRSLPWVEALLLEAYYGDDETLRLSAVRAMGRSAEERWIEYLLEQFEAGDPAFRLEAVIAVGEIGSEEAIDRIAELFVDDDEDVVKVAVKAAGEIGGEVATDYLNEFASEAPAEWGELIAEALDAATVATFGEQEPGE